MSTNHNAVRNWLNSLPGTIESMDGPEECWRKAWAACGVDCSVSDFEDVLRMYGFTVEQLGVKHILRLPGRPMAAANNADKLRNIVR